MNKKGISIIISIVVIIIVIISLILYRNSNNFNPTTNSGSITIEVIDLTNNKIEKKIQFKEGDTLFNLLNENFELNYEETIYGITLYGIGNIKTDFIKNYLSIYVDGEYSTYGISSIELKDGLVVTFKEMAI